MMSFDQIWAIACHKVQFIIENPHRGQKDFYENMLYLSGLKIPIFWPGSKNYDFLHQICDFKGKNWTAGLRSLKFLSLIDQNICKNNDQNSVFVSEAVHGEIIIWNNQIFEEGYLSNPKYLV